MLHKHNTTRALRNEEAANDECFVKQREREMKIQRGRNQRSLRRLFYGFGALPPSESALNFFFLPKAYAENLI